MRLLFRSFIWIFCLLVGCSCHRLVTEQEDKPVVPDDTLTTMERIVERGTLMAVTNQPGVNYHLHNGRPSGFHFELLDDFCDAYGLHLQLVSRDHPQEFLVRLFKNQADLCAVTNDSTFAMADGFQYIDFSLSVDEKKQAFWILHDSDSSLFHAIRQWMDEDEAQDLIRYAYFRYLKKVVPGQLHISQYDDLIKNEASRMGWDWRLIAAIIYQESRFNPQLESRKGAYGLMQLMPVVMDRYDIDDESTLEEHLEAGGKLLLHLEEKLPESITDSLERQHFILAAYNAGLGQVLEARRKAEEQGLDPDAWTNNVERNVPRQTYRFVKEVSKRYSHYKVLIE